MSISWQQSERPPALVAHPPAVSLDEAHAAIELWEHYSRKTLDPAQRLAVEHMMAENEAGNWAARTTGRCVSRQNGKGDEIEVVETWGLVQRGEAIVHTAHEIPTAKSAHQRLVSVLTGHKDLRRKIAPGARGLRIRYANGDQAVEMLNGGIIVYRTRTSGGGRGLDDISRLVVDEAQHAQPEQLASSTPILAVNPNPQTNFIGSAGIANRSDWWWRLRKRALVENPGSFAWLEHSAETIRLREDGSVESMCMDPSDRESWAVANPAYPHRIEPGFLAEQLNNLGPDLFAREHLTCWDPEAASEGGAIDARLWSDLKVESEPEPTMLGLAVDVDRAWASIGASNGGHVGSVQRARFGPWAVTEAIRICSQRRIPICIDGGGPAASLIDEIEAADVQVVRASIEDYKTACADLEDAINARQVTHGGYADLDEAVRGASWRTLGDRRVWARRNGDVSMLEAVTLARWAALEVPTYDVLESVL